MGRVDWEWRYRPREFLEYSCSCWTNPKFGFAILLLFLINSIACMGAHPWLAIKYAATTLTLRLTPSAQCTSTRTSELEANAFHIQDVVLGRWAASSANGRSSTRICSRAGWIGSGGRYTESCMTDRMWVILYEERSAGFSAKERSEMNSRGRISVTLLAGRPWCVLPLGGENGEVEDGMVIEVAAFKVHCWG